MAELDRRPLRPAWARVDLGALVRNLEHLRRRVAPARLLAVLKADAYGLGAIPVAAALEGAGIDWLGVALVEEGATLRRAGVAAPILVLDPAVAGQLPLFERHRLTPAVSSRDQLLLWRDWARGRERGAEPQAIHLKVDTGMTRLGLDPAELPAALDLIRGEAGLELAGLLSHLAEAEELASPRSDEQLALFHEAAALLTAGERSRVLLHIANSAAALHRPPGRLDLVRVGLALYGIDPCGREDGLAPVLSVAARIVQIREVPAGTRAGYGGRWRAAGPSRLAVLPIGYADGYPWRLSNAGRVLVAGRRVPVAGAVSMDLTLVDVTGVAAGVGDEAVLLGRQAEEEVTAEELARLAGTIAYEILIGFGRRLPRRYGGDEAEPERPEPPASATAP